MQYKAWWKTFLSDHPEYKVIHSHVRSTASIYLKIATRFQRKTIIHSHSTSNGTGLSSLVKRILQYPLRHWADYLMACSNEAGRWLYGEKACKKENYLFLPNAIDISKYRFCEETRARYRAQLGLEECFVLGHVGRFHEAKNHLFLLELFRKVRDKKENARLLLVGDGELRPQIEEKIRELKLTDSVILTGSQSNVSDYLQAMDVFVFPSRWEGLPVTVVEAQAAGLPCLMSDTVTTDVDLSDLVHRLPITETAPWVSCLCDSSFERMDVTKEIKQSGFDITDSTATLTEFYQKIGA